MELDSVNFYSRDIPRSVAFYTDSLGHELDYRQGDDYAAFLFTNGVRLGVKRAVEEREVPGAQTLIVSSHDAHADYAVAQEKGLNVHHQFSDDPWGLWFSVLDPDGNLIEYLQTVSPDQQF